MKIMKKILSMLLVFVMVLGLLPATTFATGSEGVVYLSISFDSEYIDDKNGDPIAYVPIPLSAIEAIDLAEYGLDNMLYDVDGDGAYETTALQLLIYAHEELYGGDWGEVNFDALPGSSYFKGGIFGFTENLVYFHNGDFPVDESQQSDYMTVGATSDRIVLEAGDFLDVASFSCYSFLWDQLGGFHLFADQEGNYTHDYAAVAGEALDVKLKHSFCDLMFGQSWVKDATDYEIYYGTVFGEAVGSVTTDGEGNAQITFPTAGTWYVWCEGGRSEDDMTHSSCDSFMTTGELCVVSSPAFAKVVVTGAEPEETEPEETEPEETEPEETEPEETEPEETVPEETIPEETTPREPQDISAVLNATLAMQAINVAQPAFGTNYGEWTVFGLARGGYYANDSKYFADYYDRIVEYVNAKAAEINKSGALDKNKSTDNSRLIMALAAIGRDATSVGNWDLVEAYSANGINWIRKQGMNGTIWTLIALDCGGYETSDPTIRQQCVDAILSAQHNDGGWSLVTAKTQPSNVDITGMTLTALYPYRDQPAVAAACEAALTWLSESQLENGGFPYGQSETSESCAWAIVATTTWGINPDTDSRFIKNGYSAVDNLLTYYLEDQAMFEHGRGAGANGMATDQATYALVAYDRFINGETALYDYSDVVAYIPPVSETPEKPDASEEATAGASLGLPEQINPHSSFNGVVSVSGWDNEAGYKLIDFIITVPTGVTVESLTATNLTGGEVRWNLDGDGKLRVVYFDANNYSDVVVTGDTELADLFTIGFAAGSIAPGTKLDFAITGMSLKKNSDSADDAAMDKVDTEEANDTVSVVQGVSYSAWVLYEGDGVDLIPADKKAVAVAITGINSASKLTYNDGTNTVVFRYSQEITAKSGVVTYLALVDSAMDMAKFVDANNFTRSGDPETITFGDTNGDGVINAQDALNVVDAWLRKEGTTPDDTGILIMNVNGDSRINTFDALAIVESFVNDSVFSIITKAATVAKQ